VKNREQLTEADFAQCPVWVANGVNQYAPREKRGAAPLLSLVSIFFTTADGTVFRGFGLVTKLAIVGPVLFAKGVQVALHFGNRKPAVMNWLKLMSCLTHPRSACFPYPYR
jgi:hypothetical protein